MDSASNLINHNKTTNSNQSWSNFNLQSAYNALQNTRTVPNAAAGSEEQLINFWNLQEHGENSARTRFLALSQPAHVLKSIESEVEKGYLEGPFDFIPFEHYCINLIGVAEGKYNKKKRLIVDLSAPHEDKKNHSFNELIDKNEFSLQYVSIDDATGTIKSLSFKCWLLKTDITDAFKCAFKMAFFGFLRCGEFTCRSYSDNSSTVLLQDITVDPTKQFFIFHLRSSKRDPFRQGVNITIYKNDTFKPVDTMRRYLSLRHNTGALPKSPLFVEDELQSSPLSSETVITSLRQLLDTLGYNTVKFCGHSFRIGAATSAAACGVEDHIIQTLGRWSSDCYIRYIQTDAEVLRRAQHDMCFHT
ncbi:unnamed protein product [Mytilus coruscus]|uniref:Tyr recombinase domain-containing protein n=1 Tax=Mytilus coruscus TaxID=42192 RepID=A0A6J8BFY3_MYTCO|nr:unnamed protein product [Mytilus coruscus]